MFVVVDLPLLVLNFFFHSTIATMTHAPTFAELCKIENLVERIKWDDQYLHRLSHAKANPAALTVEKLKVLDRKNTRIAELRMLVSKLSYIPPSAKRYLY
uniref:AsIV-cont00073-ORF1 n=1 Tax=Apophua simplicipes ichnovirus TaxID=1329648 RepID=S5DYW3_9VIRU|nr:AsIV-cont00073-ORF1 [Apophua simplicipes ichnovirus]